MKIAILLKSGGKVRLYTPQRHLMEVNKRTLLRQGKEYYLALYQGNHAVTQMLVFGFNPKLQ